MESSSDQQLHFVLFPFVAGGHLLPLVNVGRLLAERDVIVTIVTTPHNAGRIHETVARVMQSGHPIRLVEIPFPCKEVGLPEGYENIDMASSEVETTKMFVAANLMEEAVLELFEKLTPRPNCIVSDMCLHYTSKIASKFQIPRISFHGFPCFCSLSLHIVYTSNILESITSDSEYFTLPGLPHNHKVEFTKLQLPINNNKKNESMDKVFASIGEAERASFGTVLNTFEELESCFVKEYRMVSDRKVWCVGPVSLSHKDELDKAQGGNKASINEHQCLEWLDSQEPNSVIYACLGSISSMRLSQLKELGLGLEASNKRFIWVIRGNDASKVENWIKEDGFEERTKGRGLAIFGWAPQLLILSHPAIGGFLTHCGWNSTIEAISAGVPLLTWPLFADQFCNEKLAVQILKIGVSLGAEKPTPMSWDEHKDEVILTKDDVKNGIKKLMDQGNEARERRKRVREFGEMAKKAVQVGGSSYVNVTRLIQDVKATIFKRN